MHIEALHVLKKIPSSHVNISKLAFLLRLFSFDSGGTLSLCELEGLGGCDVLFVIFFFVSSYAFSS